MTCTGSKALRQSAGLRGKALRSLAIVFLNFCTAAAIAATGAEDIVAQHLDSIGTPEARAAVKSRAVQGTLRFKMIVGGSGDTAGEWQLFSEEHKSNFTMKFPRSIGWWGERFVSDGDKTSFAAVTQSHQRSPLGTFAASQDFIIKESLLGGALSTAWALQDLEHHHVKLDYLGRKKIDDQELDGIQYISSSNGGTIVKLYFDPATHRHMMTVYSFTRDAGASLNGIVSARQDEARYILEERFSEFETNEGLTLPHQYDLRFSVELQRGRTSVYEWQMTADRILENPNINPTNFQTK
jgi:hypothetical protein